jgi:hypothetical protein
MAGLGIAFDIQEDETDTGSDHFEVFPENWETVCIFLRLSTCWRKVFLPTGTLFWEGLNLTDMEAVVRNFGFKGEKARGIFRDCLYMSECALPLLNKG